MKIWAWKLWSWSSGYYVSFEFVFGQFMSTKLSWTCEDIRFNCLALLFWKLDMFLVIEYVLKSNTSWRTLGLCRSVSDFFCCWSKTGTVILTSNWLQKWERKNIHFNYHKIFWSIKCWVWYNLLKNHNRIINPFIHVLVNPSVTISI